MGHLKTDEQYMQEALNQAQKAFEVDEVPIGSVIVAPDGSIIGTGYNQVEEQKRQTAHAEMLALQKATQKVGNWRLEGCTLFVTLEPCSMCYAALKLSRIAKIVYGAQSPLFGYECNKDQFLKLPEGDIPTISGVKQKECLALLQAFFKKQRA